MNDKIKLQTFQGNRIDALTMLYLENQDLSKLTPAELAEKYHEVYKEIHVTDKKIIGKNFSFD